MIVDRVWRKQPGAYFCISTKSRAGEWRDHFLKNTELSRVPEFIEAHMDKDLYWCPHGFDRTRRLKQFAVAPKLLWSDMDEVDPRDLGKLMPSIAWESSPGRYCGLWIIDKFATDTLNQRLTYKIGADKGGWDFTQVLRIPNTKNYKYQSTPRVKLLWSDGPDYSFDDLDRLLPPIEGTPSKTKVRSTVQLYKKHERGFNSFIRRELMRKEKPKAGKRSEVIWRLTNEIMEAGCTREETFELVRGSIWNKFLGRRNGDDQLKREIDKALEKHIRVVEDEHDAPFEEEEVETDDEDIKLLVRSMQDVEEENLDWVWYPYLAKSELTILEGDPGVGKSYLAQMIAKAVCDGERLPSPKIRSLPMGKVAYFDMENSSGSVTKKRLVANGIVNLKNYFQEEEPFSIDDDDTMEAVYEAIDRLRPSLVVFDTLNTYIGKADTHKASETQQAFKTFIEIARRFNCSVLVLRHLTKSSKEKALYRGQGSIAFTGLARVVMTVGMLPDDEEDTRVMAVTKINVTRPPKALTFSITALPDTLKDEDRSEFTWGEFVDLSTDDIISVEHEPNRERKKRDDAKVFLEELLKTGSMEKNEVIKAGEARSIGEKSLIRAATELGLIRSVAGFGSTKFSYWGYPRPSKNKADKPKPQNAGSQNGQSSRFQRKKYK